LFFFLKTKIAPCGWSPRPDDTHKKFTSNTFQFFFQSELEDFRIFRRFEQLSSSIGWRVILVQSGAKTGS